jgi:DNA invertase Pin-like site-specific DNA recombinase
MLGKRYRAKNKTTEKVIKTGQKGRSKRVICYKSGINYSSVSEAAKVLGLNRTTLNSYLTRQNKNKTTLNYYTYGS